MTHSYLHRPRSVEPSTGKTGSTRRLVVPLGLAVAAALCAGAVSAQQADLLAEDAVIVYPTALDQRRAELRQALTSGGELPAAKRARQRMSPEERDALNRELRRVLRGAYDTLGSSTN